MAQSTDLNIQNFALPQALWQNPFTVGATLASAATITPTNLIHTVSGAAAIATITPPMESAHFLILIPSGAFTMTAAGNIVTAVGAAVVGAPVLCFYNPALKKYYCGKLAV